MVIDASVIINLLATNHGADILMALNLHVAVPENVQIELKKGQQRGRTDFDRLEELSRQKVIDIVRLNESDYDIVAQLVTGPSSETMDDGEAATIAYAYSHAGAIALDDAKAERILKIKHPSLKFCTTVDILMSENVSSIFDRQRLSDIVYSALQIARMRVFPRHMDWVVSLIGIDRAAQCPSLPRVARTGTHKI